MKNKIIYVQLLLLFLFQNGFSQENKKISLDDVVKIALKENYDLQIAKNNFQSAENSASLSNSDLLPKLSMSGSYIYSNMDTKTDFSGGFPPVDEKGAKTDMFSAKIELSRTIFDGFYSFNKYDQLKKQADLSNINLTNSIENTIAFVWRAYFNLVAVENDYQIASENFQISKDRLTKIERELSFGKGNETEKLNTLSALNADTLQLMSLTNTKLQALADLNLLLGSDVLDQTTKLSKSTELIALDYDGLEEKLLEDNISIQQAETNLELSELSHSMSKASRYPRISASIGYGYDKQNYDVGIMDLNETLGLSAGIQLSYTIFDWGKRSDDIENAELTVKSSEVDLNKTKMKIKQDFDKAWRSYQLQRNVVTLEEKNLKVEKSRFGRVEKQYYLGQTGSLNFRDAQLALARAKDKLFDAGVDAKLAELELLRLTGLLVK